MLAEARKDGEATGQRIVEEAKAEAERQRERAVADIETAKKVALVRTGRVKLRTWRSTSPNRSLAEN